MTDPTEGADWEWSWAAAGWKFQEFLKADPKHGELPDPEIREAFQKWAEEKFGKGKPQ
jgi:hypothetical protein